MIPDLKLYGILDPEHCNGRPLASLADDAIAGGATLLQLRDKTGSTRDMMAHASAILEAVDRRVPVLINDRVDVALAVGADGVHLGQQDLPVAIARRILGPDAIIGLSVKTVEEAENIPANQLDYVCIGGVFDTVSKDNPAAIGIDGWQALATICRSQHMDHLPIGAIAGIDARRAALLRKAGADGVAVISSLFKADDVRKAARSFIEAWEHPDRVLKDAA